MIYSFNKTCEDAPHLLSCFVEFLLQTNLWSVVAIKSNLIYTKAKPKKPIRRISLLKRHSDWENKTISKDDWILLKNLKKENSKKCFFIYFKLVSQTSFEIFLMPYIEPSVDENLDFIIPNNAYGKDILKPLIFKCGVNKKSLAISDGTMFVLHTENGTQSNWLYAGEFKTIRKDDNDSPFVLTTNIKTYNLLKTKLARLDKGDLKSGKVTVPQIDNKNLLLPSGILFDNVLHGFLKHVYLGPFIEDAKKISVILGKHNIVRSVDNCSLIFSWNNKEYNDKFCVLDVLFNIVHVPKIFVPKQKVELKPKPKKRSRAFGLRKIKNK